jgi:hypothetical protein
MSSIINSSIDPTFLFRSHLFLFCRRKYLLADDEEHNDSVQEPKNKFSLTKF